MARVVSPYSLGGDGVNPLRRILNDTIEFERLVESPIRIFITATNVRTGRARIFRNREITADVLLASACLPTMFQAVEIDGEHYWDGGYSGNPMITPLVLECDSHDTLIVQINPVVRDEIPRTAAEINNRINEVSFNASLLKELKMISLLRKVCDPSDGEGWLWAQMRIHLINSEMMRDLGASSKLNASGNFSPCYATRGGAWLTSLSLVMQDRWASFDIRLWRACRRNMTAALIARTAAAGWKCLPQC